jgi:hypothetical protein
MEPERRKLVEDLKYESSAALLGWLRWNILVAHESEA